MREPYSNYVEIKLPEQKGFMTKMFGTLIGNTKKAQVKFDITPEISPQRSEYTEEELMNVGGERAQDELRKKKTIKSKSKRKTKKKNCGCK